MDTALSVITREHHSTIRERKFSGLLSNGYDYWIVSLKFRNTFVFYSVIVARVYWRTTKRQILFSNSSKETKKNLSQMDTFLVSFESGWIFFIWELKKFWKFEKIVNQVCQAILEINYYRKRLLIISILYNRIVTRYDKFLVILHIWIDLINWMLHK